MFDIGWFELFIIIVVAVVVVGPRDLPKVMRAVGRWTGRARAMADQFRRSFEDMARQTELEEMRQEMMKIHNDRSLSEMKRETDRMLGRLPADPLNPANSISRAISESAGSPPPKTTEAPTPVLEKPAAPEPQSPLHRDEP